MDDIQRNNFKLTQLIHHCNVTQSQLNDIKKSLRKYDNLSNDTYHPIRHTHTHSRSSVILMKSSSQHMDQFQKRQSKLDSYPSAFISLNQTQILPLIEQKTPSIIKKRTHQNIPQQINKKKQSGYKYRLIEEQPQIQSQQQQESTERPLRLIRQYSNQYLPRIRSTYLQTFSPKNASLSQQALAKKQLQQSVFKKSHDEKYKRYQKARIMREYQQEKKKLQQKMQVCRFNILKKISLDNVKKYRNNENKRKQYCSVSQRCHACKQIMKV